MSRKTKKSAKTFIHFRYFSISLLVVSLVLLQTVSAAADGYGRLGPRSSASATISLTIPPHVDMTRSTHNLTVIRMENGTVNTQTSLCLQSNLVTPLRVKYLAGHGVHAATKETLGTCANGGTSATFTTTLDGKENPGFGNMLMMIEPL